MDAGERLAGGRARWCLPGVGGRAADGRRFRRRGLLRAQRTESRRVWGGGQQRPAGVDDEDAFGRGGLSPAELEERGYRVWAHPQPAGAWISEGDASNFALLIANGLRSWEHPGWGGWGGRQGPVDGDPACWSNHTTVDRGPDGRPRPDWAAARWFRHAQHDLAARLQWTVQPTYGAANHAPHVRVREGTS